MTLADLIPSLRSSLPHPIEPWLWPASTRLLPGGDLSVGGCSLAGVAAAHGTPSYVLALDEFRARCVAYKLAFHDADVAYAGKALLTRAIVRLVEQEGLLLDICSEGELAIAISAGFPADRMILHGNAKPVELLRRAIPSGVGRIVIDSLAEIETLGQVAFGQGRQRVLIRVTPDIRAGGHVALQTAAADQKFGLSISTGDAAEAVRRILADDRLELVGLHCHLGSQITSTTPYLQAVQSLVELLAVIRRDHGLVLPEINLGGGHAIAYHPGDVPLAAADVAGVLRRTLAGSCAEYGLPVPRLTVEPGRAIAGPSGVTLYRVVVVKPTATRTWVAVDGGMSDNPRPALYGARYTARLIGRLSPVADEHVTVVGRHCEAGDVLIEDALLPGDLHAGDLLAVPSTGAYHHSMSLGYNAIPRPPIVAVSAGRSWPIVRRESLAYLSARDLG